MNSWPQVGVEFTNGRHSCLKACPQASQPSDHDGRDVGNYAHHCGDHGLIENGHGATLLSDGSASGHRAERYSIVCGLSAMTWSCPSLPVVAASCAEIYPIHPTAKRQESGTILGHAGIDLGENGSIFLRSKGKPR